MRSRRAFSALIAVGLVAGCDDEPGCPDDLLAVDQDCTTSLDCADAGLAGLTCIDGRCRLACLRDRDCRAAGLGDDACGLDPSRSAVCEGQVCVPGCPERACADGQTVCASGRCAHAYEGFESAGDAAPTLESLGWNPFGRELDNRQTFIVFEGNEACAPGPNCAGPAAEGQRFVRLGTQPTPEKGTPRTAPTCRACACCLECRLNPPLQPPSVLECPVEATVPPRLRCAPPVRCGEPPPPEVVPDVCIDLCVACEACELGPPERPGALLSQCEARAAERSCPACAACDAVADDCRACRDGRCAEACADRSSAACEACEAAAGCACEACRDCTACEDARACAEGGGDAERCAALEARCDALGADGCFAVPVDYPRAELSPGEQALESFGVDLSAATGAVVLELSYVAFNVGDRYLPGEQGTSVCSWEFAPQEVVVQLCSSGCAEDDAWSDARFVDGSRASFPPPSQRGNGLPFGSQSAVDWRSGRVTVEIPPDRLGSTLHFRFSPRLSENASVGIDDIIVRRAR
jgi:hypothetical protein